MGLSDESLVAGMAAQDPDAAAAFVRRFQARVFGLAVSIVGSPELAEEVAQDAFFKAWRSAAAYDARRGRVSTWLLTITRNSAIDAIRLRREPPMDPDTLLALLAARETDETSDDGEMSAKLQQALQELPPEQAKLSSPVGHVEPDPDGPVPIAPSPTDELYPQWPYRNARVRSTQERVCIVQG